MIPRTGHLAAAFVSLLVLVPFGAGAQPCTNGQVQYDVIQSGCAAFTFEGCCNGQQLRWCDLANDTVCGIDCTQNPSCGWNDAAGFYDCGTGGHEAPNGNPPLLCPNPGPEDNDNDGYDEDVDCNDSNPNVNPGQAENCNNGVDDDCDGFVDSWDSECGGDDDTGDDDTGDDDTGDDDMGDDDTGDDDTDPFTDDDDDDATADDDDDDGGNDLEMNTSLGILCACRQDGGGSVPLALLVLGAAVLVTSRRRS